MKKLGFKSQLNLLCLILVGASLAATNAQAGDGESVYKQTCIACHGADGKGSLPGVPDFTEKSGRLAKTDSELLKNITNGFQSPGSSMAMPAKGGNANLTDEDMGNVLKYLRKKF